MYAVQYHRIIMSWKSVLCSLLPPTPPGHIHTHRPFALYTVYSYQLVVPAWPIYKSLFVATHPLPFIIT